MKVSIPIIRMYLERHGVQRDKAYSSTVSQKVDELLLSLNQQAYLVLIGIQYVQQPNKTLKKARKYLRMPVVNTYLCYKRRQNPIGKICRGIQIIRNNNNCTVQGPKNSSFSDDSFCNCFLLQKFFSLQYYTENVPQRSRKSVDPVWNSSQIK